MGVDTVEGVTRGMCTVQDMAFMLAPEYRGRGLAAELVRLMSGVARELGYKTAVGNMFVSNVRMKAATRRGSDGGMVVVGVLPSAGYLEGVGWEDVLITYENIERMPRFTSMIEENQKVRVREMSGRGVEANLPKNDRHAVRHCMTIHVPHVGAVRIDE